MDKGTPGLGSASRSDDAERAAELEQEIESIRGNLDGLVAELDHRRHRLSPVRVAREHPLLAVIAGGVTLVGLETAGALIYKARARKQPSWLERSQRLASALGRLTSDPPVRTSPGLGWKILTAAGTATAAVVGRRLARKLLSEKGKQPAPPRSSPHERIRAF